MDGVTVRCAGPNCGQVLAIVHSVAAEWLEFPDERGRHNRRAERSINQFDTVECWKCGTLYKHAAVITAARRTRAAVTKIRTRDALPK
jgi:hypothetical protein